MLEASYRIWGNITEKSSLKSSWIFQNVCFISCHSKFNIQGTTFFFILSFFCKKTPDTKFFYFYKSFRIPGVVVLLQIGFAQTYVFLRRSRRTKRVGGGGRASNGLEFSLFFPRLHEGWGTSSRRYEGSHRLKKRLFKKWQQTNSSVKEDEYL